VRWHFKTGDRIIATPVVANGIVYVGSTDAYTYALDAGTGAQRWRYHTGGVAFIPVVANGIVYIGSGDGWIYALNA
jgi:eukaryotic-like serine/threonine-protein kinase